MAAPHLEDAIVACSVEHVDGPLQPAGSLT